MNFTTYILLCVFCGRGLCGCHTSMFMNTISCMGLEIEQFPDVTESVRLQTSHIDILNTSLTTLPTLSREAWPNLWTMEVRDNRWLACEKVLSFQNYSQDWLLLVTDCDDANVNYPCLQSLPSYDNRWTGLVIILFALTIVATIVYLRYHSATRHQRRTSSRPINTRTVVRTVSVDDAEATFSHLSH